MALQCERLLRVAFLLQADNYIEAYGTAQTYARTLIRTLKEKGVDLVLSYPVFIGGGSALMRPVIECELGRDDYLFIEDPRANAIGFRMMAESRLAAENR